MPKRMTSNVHQRSIHDARSAEELILKSPLVPSIVTENPAGLNLG